MLIAQQVILNMQQTSKYQKVIIFLVFFLTCALKQAVLASYLSFNINLKTEVRNKELKVLVTALNKGDESAYHVQAELQVAGKTIFAQKQAELPINAPYQAQLTTALSLPSSGTYPLVLILHYTDANQYPFSALTVQTFSYLEEAKSPVFGQLKPITFEKEGKLQLKIKNLSENKVSPLLYLVIPQELTVEEKPKPVEIDSRSEQNLTFSLKNFSALAGSTYQVFAVAEGSNQNLHYTQIFPGTVKIISSQKILGLSYSTLFLILIVLLALFILTQLFQRKK